MVSPGELRLIESLADGSTYEPAITDHGTVDYSEIEQVLDDFDDGPAHVLERLAAHGLLASEYVSKIYICPECDAEGLQYLGTCPGCESPHAVRTAVLERECGYTGPKSEFGEESSCPNCETASCEVIDETNRYVCKDCSAICDKLTDQLECRECHTVLPPINAIERVLYRYNLTTDGQQWLDRQKNARQTVAQTLEERRFETEIDTTVSNGSESRPVHVLAEDKLLGEQRVVDLYETPDGERVDEFYNFATSIDAKPIVVTTSGVVESDVATRAENSTLTVLSAENGDVLNTKYDVIEDVDSKDGLFQRLTAALDVPVRKE